MNLWQFMCQPPHCRKISRILKAANNLEIVAESQATTLSDTKAQKTGGSGSIGPLFLVILLLVAGLIGFRRLKIKRHLPAGALPRHSLLSPHS